MSAPSLLPRLILASASARRLELLRGVGLDPEVRVAGIDERIVGDEDPGAYARRLAAQKARAVKDSLIGDDRERPVLAADTIVHVDDGGPPILGKPADPDEARAMLTRLSGRAHRVLTAYHLIYRDRERGRAMTTEVNFRALTPAELEGYVGSREWEDKAGGYAIQGIAGAFVRAVVGSYSSVVGLPVCEVLEDLDALGVLPADWTLGARR